MNSALKPLEIPAMLPVEKHLALQQQVYQEARLLDEERYAEWLAVLADDIRYRLPLTERRFRKDRSAPLSVGVGYIFDDTKARLAMRVKRLQSGLVWAEDPRNAVRRAVSNVEIWQGAEVHEADVHSVITIYRSRMDGVEQHFIAGRRDIWRSADGGWRLALRDIHLDNTVVLDSNMNTLF